MHDVRLGLCGFTMAFADYVREFPVVEVQQTFYEPPDDRTMERWRQQSPSTFEFTLKAWQLVTHDATSPTYRRLRRPLSHEERGGCGSFRSSPIVDEAWMRTVRCARILRATAVLFQCPRRFRPTDVNVARMRTFFAGIDRPAGVRLLWEPRGDWPADLVRDLCSSLDLAHVVDPFVDRTVTMDRMYLRLHGTTGARHVYSDDELHRLLDTVQSATASPVYVLFNNLPRIGDARRFRAILY